MNFVIQDPDDSDGIYLVEALLEACQDASRGGGAFAFATAAGAKLFLEDETFLAFAVEHSFDLIVGIDAITNNEALNAITSAARGAPGLNVYVFLHERQDSLFHPKFCWFRTPLGGRLVVGSGNLTIGGLRANWEAFSVISLKKSEAKELENTWVRWIETHSALLLDPTDPRVTARASRNTGWVRLVRSDDSTDGTVTTGNETANGERATGPVRESQSVLVAEIPKSGDRWNQANFDLHTYEQFFGAKVGTQRRIVLQHVNADGTLAEAENRPSVAVRSHNYRFELEAASGLSYPRTRRPIGVFVRVATRTFRYRLLMPSDPHYAIARAFLDKEWTGASNRMRRVCVKVNELRHAWPSAALWRAV